MSVTLLKNYDILQEEGFVLVYGSRGVHDRRGIAVGSQSRALRDLGFSSPLSKKHRKKPGGGGVAVNPPKLPHD